MLCICFSASSLSVPLVLKISFVCSHIKIFKYMCSQLHIYTYTVVVDINCRPPQCKSSTDNCSTVRRSSAKRRKKEENRQKKCNLKQNVFHLLGVWMGSDSGWLVYVQNSPQNRDRQTMGKVKSSIVNVNNVKVDTISFSRAMLALQRITNKAKLHKSTENCQEFRSHLS